MSEHIPDDLGLNIPPINGISMYEALMLSKRLYTTGIKFEDLTPGQVIHYIKGDERFTVTILEGSGYSVFHKEERPLAMIERFSIDGSVIEATGGLLLGVTISGDGNFPVLAIPKEDSFFMPLIIESIPNPEEDDEIKVLIVSGLDTDISE